MINGLSRNAPTFYKFLQNLALVNVIKAVLNSSINLKQILKTGAEARQVYMVSDHHKHGSCYLPNRPEPHPNSHDTLLPGIEYIML